MKYINYKYCSEAQFVSLKKRLDLLKDKILKNFPDIKEFKRLEDDDYLNLSFHFKDQKLFLGTFFIIYKDVRDWTFFDIGLFKSYDAGNRRYYKRFFAENNLSIDFIEKNYDAIINKALLLYASWGKEDLVESVEVAQGH